MSESVRVVCRCRPARQDLLRGHGQGGFDGRTDEERAAGVQARGNKAKKPASGSASKDSSRRSSGVIATPAAVSQHNYESFGLKFGPDGKSLSVMEQSASIGNSKEAVRPRPHLFTFDHCFDPNNGQADVFDVLAKDTVKDVLRGYNGSIFAYGQTGSGKTFTMFGPSNASPDLRGVIPRAADALFDGLEEIDEIDEVTIKCSFLEIYKEIIQDLLNPKNINLKIREHPNGEVYVQGLSDEYVSSAADILNLLALGEKHRTVASTDMNEVSSRSHSVLIIVVTQKLRDGSTRVGKLNLADLAGSERIERTNATGDTLEEAKKINQSLSALGNCINALTDTKRTHIPFRDSTLTFLLKDSLGGNTKTTLLVCCSGEDSDIPETLSTLNFAKRAKKIKNNVSVNTVMGVKELSAMIESLKKELALANKQIVALQKTIVALKDGAVVDDMVLETIMKTPSQSALSNALGFTSTSNGTVSKTLDEEKLSASDSDSTIDSGGGKRNHRSTLSISSLASVSENGVLDGHRSLATATNSPQSSSSPNTRALSRSPSQPSEIASMTDLHSMIEAAKAQALRDDGTLEDTSRSQTERAETEAEVLASEAARGISGVSSSLLASSVLAPSAQTDPALQSAQQLISDLQHQLAIEKAHYRKKSKQWHLENSQLRVEKEMLKVSARAGDALISNLSSAVQSKRLTPDSGMSDEQVSELLAKNERLERQMADMKQVWNSYLDLIAENQKLAAAKKEKREVEREHERERMERERLLFSDPAISRGPKIVKPVRAGDSRFFSPPKVAVPVGASPLASNPSSTVTTPRHSVIENSSFQSPAPAGSDGHSYTNSGHGTPSNSAVTSSILSTLLGASPSQTPSLSLSHSTPVSNSSLKPSATPPLSAATPPQHSLSSLASSVLSLASASPVSRSSLDHVIKRGFLSKKQMGWSLSMNKAWRRRFFLLRTMSLDYYDAAAGSISTEKENTNTDNSSESGSSNHSQQSQTALLTGSLRGTIPVDSTTSVRVVDFSDVPFGFEIMTRDKEAKLHAASLMERDEWIAAIKEQVHRIRKSAGMKDEEIARLEVLQDKDDQIDAEHPTRAVEL